MNVLCGWSTTIMRNRLIVFWQKAIAKIFIKKTLEFFIETEIANFKMACLMNDIFISRQNIGSLQKFKELSTWTKNAVKFGPERRPQIWNLISDNIKSEQTWELFKNKIRKWKYEPCSCRMCKTHLQHKGFLN